jgi:hypothetical protein
MPAGAPEFHGFSRVNACSTLDERLAHTFEPIKGIPANPGRIYDSAFPADISNKGFVAPKKRAGPFSMLNPGRVLYDGNASRTVPRNG